MPIEEQDHVTAAWIARQLGLGRAAVANWRKRHRDFPRPVAGGPNTPLFSWFAVQRWLVDTGRADQLAATGQTDTGTQLIGDAAPWTRDRSLPQLTPSELLARVLVSLLPPLGDGDPPADDLEPPVVLDPACSDATVLAAVADRFGDHVRLAGQASDEAGAESVRRALAGRPPELGDEIRVGDALRVDRFASFRGTARAVLCVPPPAARQWPAVDLAADPRWRFGLPDPSEPELAWVQHCVAHLRRNGVAVVVVSPVVGVRPSGRHVRAALVRDGVLSDVIALPAGLTPTGEGAAHVWVLRNGDPAPTVRMVDLTALAAADVPRAHTAWKELLGVDDPARRAVSRPPDPSVVRSVPRVELLDGDTALVPSRFPRPGAPTMTDDLARVSDHLRRLYTDLGRTLPRPDARPAASHYANVTLGELERSRALTILPRDATPRNGDLLFRVMGRDPIVAEGTADDERGVAQVVAIDPRRVDPHFVALFVRTDARAAPVANTHGALTRDDVRRCRVPLMPLAEQRRYGDAFRRLQELDAAATRLAAITTAVVTQTVHGLTTGALGPAVFGPGAPGNTDAPDDDRRAW